MGRLCELMALFSHMHYDSMKFNPSLYEKHSPGSSFQARVNAFERPERPRRPMQFNWSSGAVLGFLFFLGHNLQNEFRAGLLIQLWIQGALRWISTVPVKVFLVLPSVVLAEVSLIVVQVCSSFAVLWVVASDPDAQGQSPEGLAPSRYHVCAPDLCEDGLVKSSDMRNPANGNSVISMFPLGLDFHYVSECRKILCLLWMKIQCMLWICWFETLKNFH